MATVKRNKTEKTVEILDGAILYLTETEARTLKTILGNVSGDCYNSLRRYSDAIFDALDNEDVEMYETDDFVDPKFCEIKFINNLPESEE